MSDFRTPSHGTKHQAHKLRRKNIGCIKASRNCSHSQHVLNSSKIKNWQVNLLNKSVFFFFYWPNSTSLMLTVTYKVPCTTVDGAYSYTLLVYKAGVNHCIHGLTEPSVKPAHLSYWCQPLCASLSQCSLIGR